MDEQVYNRYYDTGGNYHWIGVHSGKHIVRKGEKMPPKEIHKIQMMYAVYEDGTKEPIVIDEIKDLTLEEAEPILEEHDFVKVTRCKDCTRQMICFHSDDYFCADGERREDD